MPVNPVLVGERIRIGAAGVVCIAGPCAIESRDATLRLAEAVACAAGQAGLPAIFKASYDKANRTALHGFQGIGIEAGLRVLQEVRAASGLPVVTDVHQPDQAAAAAEVADLLQVPAFLCRQTDLLLALGATGRPVNVKKGQFAAPQDMAHAVGKLRAAGAAGVLLTERGTSFGYHDLVVDLRSLPAMRGLGCPVLLDATHGLQRPAAEGDRSGGDRRLVPSLLRAGVAAGLDGIYLEVHEDPDRALSDAANALPIRALPELLDQVRRLAELVASFREDEELLRSAR